MITLPQKNSTLFCCAPLFSTSNSTPDRDVLSVYAAKTGFPIVRDRFGYLNKYCTTWNLSPHTEPFPFTGSTKFFSDIMDERAAEIVKFIREKGEDASLSIMLSGGVDSTAMTIAIFKQLDSWCDSDNFVVVYDKDSREEYPEFIDWLENKQEFLTPVEIKPEEKESYQKNKHDKGQYTLLGWAADQLFGSIVNQSLPEELYYAHYNKWLQIDNQDIEFPLPVKTLGEFLWYMNFACKYNVVCNDHLLYSGDASHKSNMIVFYDTPDFQSWSVSNFDILHKHAQQGDPRYYKTPLKEYIYDFNHDASYRDNKGKKGSWGAYKANLPKYYKSKNMVSYCIITGDGTTTDFKEPHISPSIVNWSNHFRIQAKLARNMLRFYRKKGAPLYGEPYSYCY